MRRILTASDCVTVEYSLLQRLEVDLFHNFLIMPVLSLYGKVDHPLPTVQVQPHFEHLPAPLFEQMKVIHLEEVTEKESVPELLPLDLLGHHHQLKAILS